MVGKEGSKRGGGKKGKENTQIVKRKVCKLLANPTGKVKGETEE